LEEQGLVTLDDAGIQVTSQGLVFVRAVAMVFDRYLQTDRTRAALLQNHLTLPACSRLWQLPLC